MAKASKTVAIVETASNEVAAVEVKFVKLALPKGTKVTASKRTIIAPAHEITAGKERWFEVKRLKGYEVKDGIVTIEIAESALGYRQMVKEG